MFKRDVLLEELQAEAVELLAKLSHLLQVHRAVALCPLVQCLNLPNSKNNTTVSEAPEHSLPLSSCWSRESGLGVRDRCPEELRDSSYHESLQMDVRTLAEAEDAVSVGMAFQGVVGVF